MFVNVKIVGLLGVLAISISAHPILEGFGDAAVPFISYQNRTTSSVQEIVHDNQDINKTTVDQASNSIDTLIYNVQNEGDTSEAIHELGKPEGEILELGKPGVEGSSELVKPELGKPDTDNPASVKPGADKPPSEKPRADKPAPGKPSTNKAGKPMGQDGQETTTTPVTTLATIKSTTKPPTETTTAAQGTSTANNSSPDPIRASSAVFFTLLLVLVKSI